MLEILPNEKILERIGKRIALIILFIAWCMICWMLFKIFTTEPTACPPRVLSATEKIRYERLLQKHGLAGQVSVVEVMPDGTMYFMRDGKRCLL